MSAWRWKAKILATAVVLAVGTGCQKSTDAPSSAAPATNPSTQAAASQPATPPMAMLTIDGKPSAFPAAKLVLTKKSGDIEAMLCTDDPPAALESSYRGNSFVLEMKLDIESPEDLSTAVWTFKTESKEPQDSSDGIFLDGAHRQMQPVNVKVTFDRQGDRAMVDLNGVFLAFDPHDVAAPTQTIEVSGRLDAAISEP